jgi:hypothetical protein
VQVPLNILAAGGYTTALALTAIENTITVATSMAIIFLILVFIFYTSFILIFM